MGLHYVHTYTINVPETVDEAVEMVTGVCPGTVFYSAEGDAALVLDVNQEWVALVWRDPDGDVHTDEAYLSTSPMEEFLGPKENEHALNERDLPEMKGFTTGFTC